MFDLTVGTMSQLYDRGSVCACPPVSYEPHKMQRLMPRHNLFYSMDSTPNQPNLLQSNTSTPMMDCETKQGKTLQSVLLGKVPAAYSHLTSHRKSPYQLSPPHTASSPRRSPHTPNTFLNIPSRTPPNGSPQSFQFSQEIPFSRQMSPQYPAISSPHRSSPRHLPSPHLMVSPRPSPSPRHSLSPASSCSTEVCQEEPIDLSCKVLKEENNTPSGEDKDNAGFSLLRNLLCVGKNNQTGSHKSQDSASDCSENENCIGVQVTGTTPVTLAKKNMYPVGSRVSDWLVKIIQFAKSIPEFVNLSHNDKVTLILNSWTRLLLLYMSESNFQFAVTPTHSEQQSEDVEGPPPSQPTMKSVENLQGFIRKCQTMNLDQKEYAFLRMAVLFNSGYVGLDRPDQVEQLNTLIQQLLQEHARSTRPNDHLHYSRVLLCLPALYGINCKMIENLFCKHINGNMDIDVLLKEMLQNL